MTYRDFKIESGPVLVRMKPCSFVIVNRMPLKTVGDLNRTWWKVGLITVQLLRFMECIYLVQKRENELTAHQERDYNFSDRSSLCRRLSIQFRTEHFYLWQGQTAYSTEYFPAAPQGGADGGSFNPKWSPGPELPEPIYGVSAAVFNDNIYVFGGLHINSRRKGAYNL